MTTASEPIELTTGDRELITGLVVSAFDRARSAGKSDWATMTVAVLKNRLIDLTNGEFDQTAYGAQRMIDLLAAIPELVELDLSFRPARVRLISEEDLSDKEARYSGRLRDDLWKAVFDYSSGGTYVWSGEAAVWVTEINPGDMVLPTISAEELSDLRREFVAKNANHDLSDWAEHGLGTTALPVALRRSWNSFMKKYAWDRLGNWFVGRGLQMPTKTIAESRMARKGEEVERLRRFLQRCVAVMTAEELESVAIPLAVASRVAR